MNRKKYGRKLSAIAVAAALTFMGVVQGLPQAHADPVYSGSGAYISILDPQTLDPAVHMDPVDLPDGIIAADLANNTGQPVTQPKVGTVLWANPGDWTDVSYFTYQWRYGSSPTTMTTNPAADENKNPTNVAKNMAMMVSRIGAYYQVTIMAHGVDGSTTPLVLDTVDMGPVVGLNPAQSMAWSNANYAGATPASGVTQTTITPYETTAWLTAYGYPDNTPPSGAVEHGGSGSFPKSGSSTAGGNNINSGIHSTGGGTGTYANPITFATDGSNGALAYGTEIYVPRFQKYFIAEDMCYECQADYQGLGPVDVASATNVDGTNLIGPGGDGGPGMVHFDVWVGGGGTNDVWQDVVMCENQLTLANDDGSAYMEPVIVNPPDGLSVPNPGSIWDSTAHTCNGKPLDESLAGQVGQFISVSPASVGVTGTQATGLWSPTAGSKFTSAYLAYDTTATATATGNKANTWGNGVNSPADETTGFEVAPQLGLAAGTGLCMTDHGNSTAIGTPVTMEPCAQPGDPDYLTRLSSQMFTLSGASIQINNLCIDMGYAPNGYPPPGTDSNGGGSANYTAYNAAASGTATNRQGSMPRPVSLQRCNFNANQEWEGTNNFVDMQMGSWSLADLGPIGSFPDKANPGQMIDYLYAVTIQGLPAGHYSSDFWSTPMSRLANDQNQVNVDVTKVKKADIPTTPIKVSGGGMSTTTADVLLVDAADHSHVIATLSTDPIVANADGTFSTTVTLPADLASGHYQILVRGIYGSYPAKASSTDDLSTSVTVNTQLGYNGSSDTTQRISNFYDKDYSVPTIGYSADIQVPIDVTSVTLDQHSKTLPQGTFFQLAATVAPSDATDQGITWSSSDTNVAVVYSDGTVTAVNPGTATITVTTDDGSFTDTCLVTVTRLVSGVTLDQTTKTLTIPVGVAYGDTFQLTPSVQPSDATDKSVSWSTSNSVVATVDANGVVTARGIGTATITVTTTDGRYTATCLVTVIRLVTGVVLDQSERLLAVGDGFDLTALVGPADATNPAITWSSSDPSVATVDADGHVTAISQGVATITVTTQDGHFSDSCVVTVFQPVFGISVDPVEATLTVGDTLALVATIAPEDATNMNITWVSSNPRIATVDENGVVTALKPGQVVITVATEDGGYTATSVITVQAKPKGTVDTGGSVVASTAPWAGGFGLVLLGAAAMFLRRRSQFGTA